MDEEIALSREYIFFRFIPFKYVFVSNFRPYIRAISLHFCLFVLPVQLGLATTATLGQIFKSAPGLQLAVVKWWPL